MHPLSGLLTRSSERCACVQEAAVRQYEARAASLGSVGNAASARRHEAQLDELRLSAEGEQQHATALRDVWSGSVQELERELEQARAARTAVEAERLRMLELHRKRLAQVQREGDARQAELRKAQEAQEAKAAEALAAAARQAERSVESRAKHIKSKADEALKQQKHALKHEHTAATHAAVKEAARLAAELDRAEGGKRQEVRNAVRAANEAHARELSAVRATHHAQLTALGKSLASAEREMARRRTRSAAPPP